MTGGVLVLAVAAALLALWYRSYYNIWPGQDATARVHWCERDYQDGGPRQTWQEVTAGTQFPVRDVGRYPPLGWPGQQLFAPIAPDARPGSCATVIYLRAGPDRYRPYDLLGGP